MAGKSGIKPNLDTEDNGSILSLIGSTQTRYPLLSAAFVLLATLIFLFLTTLSGGPSKLYNFLTKAGVPLTTQEAFYFDAGSGVCFTLALLIISAIAQARGTEIESRKAAQTILAEAIEKVTLFVEHEFYNTIELRQGVLKDTELRRLCIETSQLIVSQISTCSGPERIIRESIIEGYRDRLIDVSAGLSKDGLFMDPRERRELTSKLYEHSETYIVIMTLCCPVLGAAAATEWHRSYLDFVNQVLRDRPDGIAWVYMTPERIDTRQKECIDQILGLGIPCYTVTYGADRGDVINGGDLDTFLSLGPLIEVFSADFRKALHANCALNQSVIVPWKSTSFRTREGGAITARDARPLTMAEAIRMSDKESVWACEKVAKLIRAGTAQSGKGATLRTLSYICERGKLERITQHSSIFRR